MHLPVCMYNNKCAFSIYICACIIIKEHNVPVLFFVNVDIYVRFYVLILHDYILPIPKFPQRVSVSVQANKKEKISLLTMGAKGMQIFPNIRYALLVIHTCSCSCLLDIDMSSLLLTLACLCL